MKLFQIEEPDGSPTDSDTPGAAIGIDASGKRAEIAVAIGGNAVILADREGFALDLTVPTSIGDAAAWQTLFEGARIRGERALARPVTHAVVTLAAPDAAMAAAVSEAAAAAGLTVLRCVAVDRTAPAGLAAAVLAEELVPRPSAPG